MNRIFKAAVALGIILLIAIPAYAHPGRTDGAGGHTNRSTGEYHYHHGCPEHDHYDMDGDGKKDCPYHFVDNEDKKGSSKVAESTKHESGNSAKDKMWIVLFAAGFNLLGYFVFWKTDNEWWLLYRVLWVIFATVSVYFVLLVLVTA
jgi:hypothetical protein